MKLNASFFETWFQQIPQAILLMDHRGVLLEGNLQAFATFPEIKKGQELTILPEAKLWMDSVRELSQASVLLDWKGPSDDLFYGVFLYKLEVEGSVYFGLHLKEANTVAQMRAELANSESRFYSLFNTAIDSIILIDTRGIMQQLNPAITKQFGYSIEELQGQNVKILMPEPDRGGHDKYLQNYLQTGLRKIIGIGREVTAKRKDGTLFPISLSVTELKLGGDTFFAGMIHDISDQKSAQEQLRRYAAELKRSNEDLQDFAYISSHDLQEPLRKIQTFGERLQSKEQDSISEDGKDYLNRMLNAAARMQKLISDLLEFSRVTTKAQPFEKVSLNTLCQEVLSDLEIAIERTGAIVKVGDLPEIEGDNTQLRQLFQNLVVNALKFSKEGQVPHIEISGETIQEKPHQVSLEDLKVKLTFKDDGIGFDNKYADKIFNVFQRLEGRKYEGSGIGLAICKKIVVRHGGSIMAESALGKGCSFHVYLPIKQKE
jgi:two-component system sensor kinase FixL